MGAMKPQVPAGQWEEIPPVPGMLFPVAPDDVPEAAVRVVKRTLLRHPSPDPMDDELARLLVAMVIAVLVDAGEPAAAAEIVSDYTLATGDVVSIQALPE